MDLNAKSELFEKIANMMLYSVPDEQIAIVCKISVEQLEKIKALDAFEAILSTKEYDNIDRQKTLNEGWDTVEENALAQLVVAMDALKDPEFALKVAAVANKAQRRGGRMNRPIEGNLGSRAVINLNQVFVERLQSPDALPGNVSVTIDGKSQEKKVQNILAPTAVEKLLRLSNKSADVDENSVDRMLENMPAFAL